MKDRIFVIDEEPDELEPLLCPYCKKVGLNSVLGNKILMPNEVKQPDYENWLQCPKCGYVYALHEVPAEDTVKNTVETIENPFESAGNIESIPKCNSPAGKKKRRNRLKTTQDKDIELAIKQHGEDNVKVHREK